MKKPTPKRNSRQLKDQSPTPVEASRHLHDGVCQTLTAVQFLAKVLLGKMEARQSPDAPAMRELNGLLQRAREELSETLRLLQDNEKSRD